MKLLVMGLCCAAALFLVAAGWFALVQDWKMSIWCVGATVVAFGVAFVMASLSGVEPE